MHMLSPRNRSEFLAVPQLVRLTVANGSDGPECTLLIKASTLTLKYLLLSKRIKPYLFRVGEAGLAYGIHIEDDPVHPAILWSVVERSEEQDALHMLADSQKCVVILINELAVNVAWGETAIDLSDESLRRLIEHTKCLPDRHSEDQTICVAVDERLDALYRGDFSADDGKALDWCSVPTWHPITSHYITNGASSSLLSIFETDEGRQQEELALWLIDCLHPAGAIRSPQIQEPSRRRELTDLLLTYDFGAFLVESKSLSILARQKLPTRDKLARDLAKDVEKAVGQLIGAVKNLRRGFPVTTPEGKSIDINIDQPPHILLLVPDLALLADSDDSGPQLLRSVMEATGGFLHVLDPSELLRMVQAAVTIASRGQTTTPMMAFDYYLMERAKRAVSAGTLNFNMLLRFQESDDESSSLHTTEDSGG